MYIIIIIIIKKKKNDQPLQTGMGWDMCVSGPVQQTVLGILSRKLFEICLNLLTLWIVMVSSVRCIIFSMKEDNIIIDSMIPVIVLKYFIGMCLCQRPWFECCKPRTSRDFSRHLFCVGSVDRWQYLFLVLYIEQSSNKVSNISELFLGLIHNFLPFIFCVAHSYGRKFGKLHQQSPHALLPFLLQVQRAKQRRFNELKWHERKSCHCCLIGVELE